MDCCSVQRGLSRMFDGRMARHWARGFHKRRALPRRQRALIERLAAEGIAGATVLDIGFGVGDLHFELLRRGAGSVTGVEVSAAMAEQAGALAAKLGFAEQVTYRLGDYVQLHEAIGDVDIVVLVVPEAVGPEALVVDEQLALDDVGDLGHPGHRHAREVASVGSRVLSSDGCSGAPRSARYSAGTEAAA